MKYKVADFFCGAGGGGQGFALEGFKLAFSNDMDMKCAATYQHNLQEWVYVDSISSVTAQLVFRLAGGQVDVVIGGPPCQSFSHAKTTGPGKFDCKGIVNLLEMQRLVSLLRPKIFICENVPAITEMIQVYHKFLHGWDMSYKTYCFRLDTYDFGIPQNRERIFIVGIRNDMSIKSFRIDDYKEPNLFSGWAEYLGLPINFDLKLFRRASGNTNLGRDCFQPAFTVIGAERMVIRSKDLCIVGNRIDSTSLNPELKEVQRELTVEELAKLQGFPKDYSFLGSKNEQIKQIGNAWSIPIARALAKECKRVLEGGIDA